MEEAETHWLPNIAAMAQALHQSLEKVGIMKNGMINGESLSMEEDSVYGKKSSLNRAITSSFSCICLLTNTPSNLRNGQQVVAIRAAQHHIIAQRIHKAQAVRHVAQLHMQLLIEASSVCRLAADGQPTVGTDGEHQARSLHILPGGDLHITRFARLHLLHPIRVRFADHVVLETDVLSLGNHTANGSIHARQIRHSV